MHHVLLALTTEMPGSIYLKYTPSLIGWELVIMLEKVALQMVDLFFTQRPVFQATIAMIVLVASLCAHLHAQPFPLRIQNQMQTAAKLLNFLLLMSGEPHVNATLRLYYPR